MKWNEIVLSYNDYLFAGKYKLTKTLAQQQVFYKMVGRNLRVLESRGSQPMNAADLGRRIRNTTDVVANAIPAGTRVRDIPGIIWGKDTWRAATPAEQAAYKVFIAQRTAFIERIDRAKHQRRLVELRREQAAAYRRITAIQTAIGRESSQLDKLRRGG